MAVLFCLLPGAQALGEETVRIAIVERATQIALSGKGLQVRLLATGERYAAAKSGRSEVVHKKDGMYLDGVRVTSPDGVRYRSQELVQVAGKPVRGQIEVRPDGSGRLVAINVVPLEAYLHAVLGSEMPASFPEEALKAQAVAARTYALQKKIAAWGKPYHLGSTVLHQVYGGTRAEDPRTKVAVDATRGEVLIREMALVEAYFHSNCGGRTEAGGPALGRPLNYLQPVTCPCAEIAPTQWRRTFTAAQMSKLLPGLKDIRIIEKTGTGRVVRVELTSGKAKTPMGGVQLRERLGYGEVKSLLFQVEKKGGAFHFSGKGFGHGAGMCQWGARRLAEKGKKYRDILAHYYTGSEVIKMY
jgi:stage II sporulation protein D